MKHVISMGGGVQSSTMAILASQGLISPMPDACIFADTQSESIATLEWLDHLETLLPFPVIRATAGSLKEDSLRVRYRKRDGQPYLKGLIPAFMQDAGLLGRSCTANYKVTVIRRTLKKFLGLEPRDRFPKNLICSQWLGISWDEIQRMKVSVDPWMEFRHPLIELKMTRWDCLEWMETNGFPEPPRSACTFCPFHSDAHWKRFKENSPEEFLEVVQYEKDLQESAQIAIDQGDLDSLPFLHRDCIPLDEVDFDKDKNQLEMNFSEDCSGLCGV